MHRNNNCEARLNNCEARLVDGQNVTAATVSNDGIGRELKGLQIVTYDIPEGCVGRYILSRS
jgi:hypothetical protein